MKYFELEAQEKQLLKDFEDGNLVSVAKSKKEKLYQEYTQNTLQKTKNINLRLSQKDLQKLRAKAAEKGLPYQTLAASILHRFANRPG